MESTNFLFLFFGFSIILALIFSRLATLAKAPLIVGYIIAGAILGPDLLGVFTENQVVSMDMINIVTLSFIGFGIGGELKLTELKKLGKSIILIVIFEASAAFIVVGILTGLLLKSIPLGLIYGALASATAPAGTVEVIKQYKAKGDLTTTLYAVMGLDDIFALILYTLATPLALILLAGNEAHVSVINAMGHAGFEIIFSLFIGCGVGYLLTIIAKKLHDPLNLFFLSLGTIFINCWFSEIFHLSPILINMAAGIIAVNMNKLVAGKIFKALGSWTPPLYIWFFVLIGTRLNIHLILKYILIVVLYIIGRSLGKWTGAFFGAKVSKAPTKTRKYLGFALFSQAGVAVGLALAAAKSLEEVGFHTEATQIISVITATTFLIMLIGPVFAKYALVKSGEARVTK